MHDTRGSPSPVPLHDLTTSIMFYEDASVYGEPFTRDAEGFRTQGRDHDDVDETDKVCVWLCVCVCMCVCVCVCVWEGR